MSSADRERIRKLFRQAIELPQGRRRAFLDLECGSDASLRAEVESLLAAPSGDGSVTRSYAPGAAERERRTSPVQIGGYRILRELGSGGMGTVFEAHQERMNRRVALKVLSTGRSGGRFEQEAWIAGKLTHPNIVKVFEQGRSGNDSYYSMELVEGGSLHDVIQNMRRDGRDGRLGLEFGSRAYMEWAIGQIVLASRALHYTHAHGVVHRDIKPMNLLLDGVTAEVKIADFGLALEQDVTRLTTEGRVLGTLRYMAPEQLSGQRTEFDGRTDVYALGVTLFELLTLEYPYRGETFEQYISAVLTEPARRSRSVNDRVSSDLEIVIGKALEKEPRNRYPTAGELADDLDNVLHFRPIVARRSNLFVRAGKWVRRKPVHAALIATLAVGTPIGGWFAYRNVEQQRSLRQAQLEDLMRRINRLDRFGDQRQVVALSSQMLRLDPDNPAALRSRAISRFNLSELGGSPDEAEALRNQALEDIDRLVARFPDRSGPRRLQAYLLRRSGREAEADRVEDSLAGLQGGGEDDLFVQGVIAEDLGDYDRAEEIFSEVLLLRNRADAVERRAFVRFKLGQWDRAVEDYRWLNTVDPKDHFPHLEIGWIRTQQGRYDEADRHLRRALDLEQPDPRPVVFERLADNSIKWGRASVSTGLTEEAGDRFRDAEDSASRGLELDDSMPSLHLNLGVSLIELYRLSDPREPLLIQRAMGHYREVVSLASGDTEGSSQESVELAKSNLCDALIESRDFATAVDACREVVELRPDHPLSYYNLAGVYALTNQTDDALRMLERDFELGDLDHGYLGQDPWFVSVRDDPRFQDLLARMERKARSAEAETRSADPLAP